MCVDPINCGGYCPECRDVNARKRPRRTARKVTLESGNVVLCVCDEGIHYMVADHWPEPRDYDVCAYKVDKGFYEVIVAGTAICTANSLKEAVVLADRDVCVQLGPHF